MNIAKLYKIFKEYPLISTDSRNPKPDSIFFALKGESFDGNRFAKDALKVCKYAVVDDPEVVEDDRYLLVSSVLIALQNLSRFHRNHLDLPIIAITGTNGKTTTKELISAVLNKKYKAYSTVGNFNNHIGVPLSLLEITTEHELAVIEMGASKQGDIKELCEIAQPTHGIITNVGKAHLEGFGSFEKVMKTKGELYDFLYLNNGTAFVNYDDEYLEDMNPPRKTIHYGVSRFTHCQGQLINEYPFVSFKWIATGEMVYDDGELDWSAPENQIQLKLVGAYNYENALAAVCIGNYFDVDAKSMKEALEAYEPKNLRSQFKETDSNTLIIDSYNANPTSMKLALDGFAGYKVDNKILILGDMLELGRVSRREHDVLIHHISELEAFDDTYFVGEEFYNLKNEITQHWFKNVDELVAYFKDNPLKGKTILLKGSRGIKLEKVIDSL
ncbi:MAG: UDP-N-acetylmuramoyl-tripeptide--D-alanyl-D-alanine ligase [Salinivirgaceae bacterium]|nr:MAG: UDP-N-acetylmuramoyl-tripeptide--D-alanyl-D-alanine ligase [Salinivirgaceae bacterium]